MYTPRASFTRSVIRSAVSFLVALAALAAMAVASFTSSAQAAAAAAADRRHRTLWTSCRRRVTRSS